METAKRLFPLNQADESDRSNTDKKPERVIRLEQGKPPGLPDAPMDLRAEVEECLIEQEGIDLRNMPEEEVARVVEDIRMTIADRMTVSEAVQNNLTVIDYKDREDSLHELEHATILSERTDAIDYMGEYYGDVIKNWESADNENRLTDGVMAQFYRRNDHKMTTDRNGNSFLTTYFDSAQFGMVNELLDSAAEKISERKMGFIEYMQHYLSGFVRHFDPSLDRFSRVNEMGVPENVIFERNGTKAFELFCRNFIKQGDNVLVTQEEYSEMLGDLKHQGTKIITLPGYGEIDSYEEAIQSCLSTGEIDYMLVSSLGRRGTVFPMERLYELCKAHNVDLIADVCQSIGRRTHGFPADVFVGSIQKGAELGEPPLGFLMMSDDLIAKTDSAKFSELAELKGTVGPLLAARAFIACNPNGIGTLNGGGIPDELKRKMTMGVEKREQVTNDLGCKFAELVQAINQRHGDRIEFYTQNLVYSGTEVNRDQVGPIFECRIKGVTREQVQRVAESYGATINDYFYKWDEDGSFRVCFHPFMSNDSVKILGRVLDECCEL